MVTIEKLSMVLIKHFTKSSCDVEKYALEDELAFVKQARKVIYMSNWTIYNEDGVFNMLIEERKQRSFSLKLLEKFLKYLHNIVRNLFFNVLIKFSEDVIFSLVFYFNLLNIFITFFEFSARTNKG